MRRVLLLFVIAAGVRAQSPDGADTASRKSTVLSVEMGACVTPSASAYFSAMQRTLGTKSAAFPALMGISGTLSIDFSPHFSVLLQAQQFSLAHDDAGNFAEIDTATGVTTTFAQSTERWSVQTYPFHAGVRFTPVSSRFQSYCMALAGIAVTHLRWDHTTSASSTPSRFPTASLEQTVVAPSLAFGVGLELMFDQFNRHELLRGIVMEARYRWTESRVAMFAPIKQHSSAPAPEWGSSYALNMSGFELFAGVQLQFFH